MEVQVFLATPFLFFEDFMEHQGKEKNVYKGIWIAFIVLLMVPAVFFLLFFSVIKSNYEGQKLENLIYASLTFSCAVGFLFCLVLIFTGFIKDLFVALIDRIKETFEYFTPFSKDATKWYFYKFWKDGGIIMWLFLLTMVAYLVITIISASKTLDWYFTEFTK